MKGAATTTTGDLGEGQKAAAGSRQEKDNVN